MRIFGRRADGGPVATYAAVLDGVHLWWCVPGHDRLVLRASGSGAEVLVDRDPFPLTALTTGSHDLHAAGERVRMAALPDRTPSRVPLAPDGRSQYVVSLDAGHLRVECHDVAPAAVLRVAEPRGDRVHLQVLPPEGVRTGLHLVLLDTEDGVLDVLPVTAHDGHVDALIGVDDLPAGYFGMVRLAVGSPEEWVRIRRSHTDLADPNPAVLLPELPDAADERHPDRVRARLRWSPDSLLTLRALDPDAGDRP